MLISETVLGTRVCVSLGCALDTIQQVHSVADHDRREGGERLPMTKLSRTRQTRSNEVLVGPMATSATPGYVSSKKHVSRAKRHCQTGGARYEFLATVLATARTLAG